MKANAPKLQYNTRLHIITGEHRFSGTALEKKI